MVADTKCTPGAHLAAAFGERGAPLDAAQARRVLDVLLRLHELGALVFEGRSPLANRGPSKYAESVDA